MRHIASGVQRMGNLVDVIPDAVEVGIGTGEQLPVNRRAGLGPHPCPAKRGGSEVSAGREARRARAFLKLGLLGVVETEPRDMLALALFRTMAEVASGGLRRHQGVEGRAVSHRHALRRPPLRPWVRAAGLPALRSGKAA